MPDNPIITVRLDVDERYPEVLITDSSGYYSAEIEVDAVTLERWRAAISAFEEVQREMLGRYREAGGKG